MVDAKSLKLAAVVVGGAVALFVASFVLRLVGRILSWAVLLGLALAAGYVVYQLYSGWNVAGEELDAASDATDDVESAQERYASGELSESELEAELEGAVDDEWERERGG
jgi:uncharacterized membrane protein